MKKGGYITIVVAIIGALGLVIAALINRPMPSPQPPSNTIPALHGSYSGTLAIQQTNTTTPQYISSLSESHDGSFMAEGSIGNCTATYSGRVSSDNTISFYGTEGAICRSIVVTFYGQLFSDGHMGGTWTETNTSYTGTWTVS